MLFKRSTINGEGTWPSTSFLAVGQSLVALASRQGVIDVLNISEAALFGDNPGFSEHEYLASDACVGVACALVLIS